MPSENSQLAKALKEAGKRKLSRWAPHPKQLLHLAAGSIKTERALFAANRSGKSLTCAAESAVHATGRYPDWWKGHVIRKPSLGWACGTSNEITRDVVQNLLMGPSETEWGTGMIPAADIVRVDKARGMAGAIDKVIVKHQSGGNSIVQFKSYEQTWKKFTSADVDWIWLDEEPDEKIYKECLARITTTNGIVYLSLTPLQGQTSVVKYFYPTPNTIDRGLTMMTIDDALHMTDEMREKAIAKYAPYEREARLKGIPMLGSGRVFPLPESAVHCDPFEIPDHWPRIIGMDFGYDHPTAAVDAAWDRDADVLYVTQEYSVTEHEPVYHAAAIRAWGDWKPIMWPHDGHRRYRGGKALADEYRHEGLRKMHFEHVTFPGGGISLEAGVMQMLDRMRTGRLKVFRNCGMWFDEFRTYHRKDGKIVDERDDLLAATRYAMMGLRFAKTAKRKVQLASASDWDPLDVGAVA